MISYLNSKKKLLIFFYFFLLLLIGFFIFPDYGISLDEDNTRLGGFVTLKYIFEVFFPSKVALIDEIITVPSMADWKESGIGPIFDLPTAFIEFFFKIEDSRQYYLMRHFINFLFFLALVYFFFLLIIKRYNSFFLGILGSTFLILSPRIFAQSFYNNKDIVFMSLFTIGLYSLINFLEKPNIKNALILSFISSLAIDIRILGVMLPALTLLFYVMNMLRNQKYKKKPIIPLLILLISLPFFITFFWPYLWPDPLNNFIATFKSLSNFHAEPVAYSLYLGEYIRTQNSPWHYQIVWIFATTPVFYIILFIVGFIFLIRRFVKRIFKIEKIGIYDDFWRSKKELHDQIFLFSFVVPLFYIISFNSPSYDGWRHLYFIYPSFLMISLFGLHIIKITFFKKNKNLLLILSFLLVIPTCFWMFKYHPYQNVYFNFLTGKNFKTHFEMDYWGLSNVRALEEIAKNENKKVNVSHVGTSDLTISQVFLQKKYRDRISITDKIKNSNYIINHYRNWLGKNNNINFIAPLNYEKFYEIKVDDVPINTIYKKIE